MNRMPSRPPLIASSVICSSFGGMPHMNKRRQREDDSAGQRTRCGPGRLRDVGFEDRTANAEFGKHTKHGDGHDRYRD